jgi:glycosyltransferase involved in cell wall biosynthesis
MKKHKVSFLMTIYNHQNYLKDSIESIINQSYKNWELVAVDNGSTDKSKKVLKRIKNKKIKLFFLKNNIGRTNCLNFGLKKCSGDFIAILDSDDIAHKNRIETQLNQFNLDKKLFMVATDFNYINEKKKIIPYPKTKLFLTKNIYIKPRIFLLRNLFVHSSVMYKRSIIKKVGGYPSKFLYSQDYAFYLKIFQKYKIKFLDKKLVNIRAPHKKSESVRILSSNVEAKEHIRLLLWNISNLNTSFYEKFLILIKLIIKIIKICVPKSLINKRFKILN